MEEVEKHLRTEFAKVECSFLDEWTQPFSSLPSEFCFETVVRLLWRIEPSLRETIPTWKLPPSAIAKFRVATTVAEAIKEIGVRAPVGFQTLIYGSGKELLNLFIELIKIAPTSERVDDEEEELSPRELLLRQARLLGKDDVWVPEFCRRLKMRHDGRFWCPSDIHPELVSFSSLPSSILACESGDPRVLMAALISQMDRTIHGRSSTSSLANEQIHVREKPALPPKPQKPSLPPKPLLKNAEGGEEETAESSEAWKLEADIARARDIVHAKKEQLAQVRQKKEMEHARLRSAKIRLEEFDEQIVNFFANPDKAKGKLLKYIHESDERLRETEEQWNELRNEKVTQLRELQAKNEAHSNSFASAEYLKQKVAKIELDISEQKRLQSRLARKAQRVENEEKVDRQEYIQRIYDITANIKKQREEIAKVEKETLLQRKDVRWSSEAVGRTFELLEDMLFKKVDKSTKDERVYKNLIKLHHQCQDIVKTISASGHKKTKIEDLQDQIESEKQKNMDSQVDRMLRDLQDIQAENEHLEQLIQDAQGHP